MQIIHTVRGDANQDKICSWFASSGHGPRVSGLAHLSSIWQCPIFLSHPLLHVQTPSIPPNSPIFGRNASSPLSCQCQGRMLSATAPPPSSSSPTAAARGGAPRHLCTGKQGASLAGDTHIHHDLVQAAGIPSESPAGTNDLVQDLCTVDPYMLADN
jgi:hypothetical protein